MSSEITSTVTLAWYGSDFSHQYTLSIQVVRQSLETQFPAWWKIEYVNALWSYDDAQNCWNHHGSMTPSRSSVLHLSLALFFVDHEMEAITWGEVLFSSCAEEREAAATSYLWQCFENRDWISRVGQTKTSIRCIWCYGRQRFAHSEGSWDYVEGKIELLQLMRARVTTKWVRSVMGGDWPF